jgi:predicted amidohydrolase YtcJ
MHMPSRSVVVLGVIVSSAAAWTLQARASRLERGSMAAAQQDPSMSTPLPAADLVLVNGRVVTLDRSVPEAQAIAIRDDRVYYVGTTAAVKERVGPSTDVIDLHGQLAVPGFIESHGHFTAVGEMQLQLDLTQARSWNDIVAMVDAAVKKAKPGEWIYGRGWHQEKWSAPPDPNVEGFPTHASLDRVSPDNPVVLAHASGHATFVNAKALQASSIDASTKSPDGGEILHDASGEPTGLLRETADRLLKGPERSVAERDTYRRKVLELADKEVLSKGITTFQDAGSTLASIDAMKKIVDEKTLGVRLWVMMRQPNATIGPVLKKYRMIDYGEGHLTVRAIKKQIDGALGSRGAWLLEPYADKPDSTGLNTTSVQEIEETARLAVANNYQLCVHAIGDRANRETLDIFERTFKANPTKRNLRWRVEHAQHLSAQDIPRFGALGVIASMQGIHCTSDAPYVLARLGEKRAQEGAYVWQKLLKSGARIANGTDVPVEDVDPIANFYATVTRRLKDGSAFFPDQRMSRREALRSYTADAAYAAFEDSNRGTLAKGKYADITVLSKDILDPRKVPDDQIRTAKVVYTIVGGKVLYKK